MRSTLVRTPLGGFPRYGYRRGLPPCLSEKRLYEVQDCSRFLPTAFEQAGFCLLGLEARGADPWVLYDPWGIPLAQWEQLPSLGELWAALAEGEGGAMTGHG